MVQIRTLLRSVNRSRTFHAARKTAAKSSCVKLILENKIKGTKQKQNRYRSLIMFHMGFLKGRKYTEIILMPNLMFLFLYQFSETSISKDSSITFD